MMLSHSQRMPLRDSRLGSEPQHHRPRGSLPHPHFSQMRETETSGLSHHRAGTEGDVLPTVCADCLITKPYSKSLSSTQDSTALSSRPASSLYRSRNWEPETEGTRPVSHSQSGAELVPGLGVAECCLVLPSIPQQPSSVPLRGHAASQEPLCKPRADPEHPLSWAVPRGELSLAYLDTPPMLNAGLIYARGSMLVPWVLYKAKLSTNSWGILVPCLKKHPFLSTLSFLSLSQFSIHAKIDSLPLTTHFCPVL